LAPFGFGFSLDQIEGRAIEIDKHLFAEYEAGLASDRKKAA